MNLHRPIAVTRKAADVAVHKVAKRLVVWFLVWLSMTTALFAQRGGSEPSTTQSTLSESLSLIPPGTLVVDEQAASWNRVILLATPRIASGDINKLSASVRSSVSKLTLSILASVTSEVDDTGTPAYRIEELGLAYSALVQGKLKTVTSESAPRLGAELDFYSRQMLSENEKQIAAVKLVVRTPTLAIFDAPTILLRNEQHQDFTTRHLVWIDGATGKLALAVWLLSVDQTGRPQVADDTLRIVAPGTREDRKIHIDGRSFFLGIPSSRAFALEDLPPGRDVRWSNAAKSFAARNTYDSQTIRDFAAALNELLASSSSRLEPR